MNKRIIDITGKKFGRLTVMGFSSRTNVTKWECVCDCGKAVIVEGDSLKKGATKSCGCYRKETTIAISTTHGHSIAGKTTSEYNSWASMIARCNNAKGENYKYYGGRGITVCDEWLNFKAFLKDMGEKPTVKHSLERKDSNGNYEPSNCRWATQTEQANNKNNNRILTIKGESLNISEWAKRSGVDYTLIYGRVYDGWSAEDAVFGKKINYRLLVINGEALNISEWAKISGVSEKIIRKRIFRNWSAEDAVFTKSMGKSRKNSVRSRVKIEANA